MRGDGAVEEVFDANLEPKLEESARASKRPRKEHDQTVVKSESEESAMSPTKGDGLAVDSAEKMSAFEKTLRLQVPISTVISISSLSSFEELSDLCKILDGLIENIEIQGKIGDKISIQTSILDASEFMAINKDRLCTRDLDILKILRKLLVRFEALVNKLKSKFDYRTVSIFMEDSIGGVHFTKNAALGASFRKLKNKVFRAVTLTWEERDRLIATLLTTVNEKRRAVLKEGRPEIRGYEDMSDEELQAWKIFASELTS